MTPGGAPETALALDLDRVLAVADAEFTEFERRFPEQQLSSLQEDRAMAIALISRFIPEALNPVFLARMIRLLDRARQLDSWTGSLWFQCLPIQAAVFSLTNLPEHARTLVQNLDHGNSSLRLWVMEVLALIVPELSLDDPELERRAVSNFESMHFHCEHGALLVLVARGDADRKRALLDRLRSIDRMNEGPRQVLDDISKHGWARNSTFPEVYVQFIGYLMTRLVSSPPDFAHQAHSETPLFDDKRRTVPAALVLERIRAHPLLHEIVTVFPHAS